MWAKRGTLWHESVVHSRSRLACPHTTPAARWWTCGPPPTVSRCSIGRLRYLVMYEKVPGSHPRPSNWMGHSMAVMVCLVEAKHPSYVSSQGLCTRTLYLIRGFCSVLCYTIYSQRQENGSLFDTNQRGPWRFLIRINNVYSTTQRLRCISSVGTWGVAWTSQKIVDRHKRQTRVRYGQNARSVRRYLACNYYLLLANGHPRIIWHGLYEIYI